MVANTDQYVGLVISDRYILIERIGSGGTGPVYRAEHALLRNRLAVKLIEERLSSNEEALALFHKQLTAIAQIESENLVRFSDFGRTDEGLLYVAMDFVEGRTLANMLQSDGPFDQSRSEALMGQLCDVFEEAHALGIVHGSLHPRRVLLTKRKKREIAKLLGLGLAHLTGVANPDQLSQLSDDVLDAHYVCPELARGETFDERGDIYALGLLAYAMAAGSPPFRATGRMQLIGMHASAEPEPLQQRAPNYSSAYCAAVSKALSKQPQQRFASAAAFFAALCESGSAADNDLTVKQQVALDNGDAGVDSSGTDSAETTDGVTDSDRTKPMPMHIVDPTHHESSQANESSQARPSPASAISEPESATRTKTMVRVQDATDTTPNDGSSTASSGKSASGENEGDPSARTLIGVGISAADVQQAIERRDRARSTGTPSLDNRHSDKTEQPEQKQPATEKKGNGVAELKPELFNSAKAAPVATNRDQFGQPSDTKHSPTAADTAEIERLKALSSESGEWFAEGLEAERALQKAESPKDLPAIYDDDDDVMPKRYTSTMMYVAAGVAVVIIALVVVLFVGSRNDAKNAAPTAQRITPASTQTGSEKQIKASSPKASIPDSPLAESMNDASNEVVETTADTTASRSDAQVTEKSPEQNNSADNTKDAENLAQPAEEPAGDKQRTASNTQPHSSSATPSSAPKSPSNAATADTTKQASIDRRASIDSADKQKKEAPPRHQRSKAKAAAKRQVDLANAELKRGSYQRARSLFAAALKLDETNAEASGGIGEVEFELGNYRSAATNLRTAIAKKPNNSRYHVMLGNVYFKLGRTDAAIKRYQRALALNPKNAAARAGLEAAVRKIALSGG